MIVSQSESSLPSVRKLVRESMDGKQVNKSGDKMLGIGIIGHQANLEKKEISNL